VEWGEELRYTTPNINVLMIFNALFTAKLGPLLSKEGAVLAPIHAHMPPLPLKSSKTD